MSKVMTVAGWVSATVGAAVTAWGLVYLSQALAADNRTNEFRELGILIGSAASVLGAVIGLVGGVVLVWVRRRRTREH